MDDKTLEELRVKMAAGFNNLMQGAQNLPPQVQGLGSTLQHALVGGLAMAGVGGAGVAASKLYSAATKGRDFRAMMQANPDLHEMQQGNPMHFNQMFTTLRNMNPAFSKDPLVAGHYMRIAAGSRQDEQGGVFLQAAQMRDPSTSPVMDAYLKGGVEGVKAQSTELARQPSRMQERDWSVQDQMGRQQFDKDMAHTNRVFQNDQRQQGQYFQQRQQKREHEFRGSQRRTP